MPKENEIKIAPPRNEEFTSVWDGFNKFIEKLIVVSKKVPNLSDLKSENIIDQSETIGKVTKEIKSLEPELNDLMDEGLTFLGKPNFEFDEGVDVRLATLNYTSLLTLRISYAERNYLQVVHDIQRIEDFIHKHNSNLRSDKSLSYGRKSIMLGFAGIILGVVNSLFSFYQPLNQEQIDIIEQRIVPVLVDSVSKDSVICESDSLNID